MPFSPKIIELDYTNTEKSEKAFRMKTHSIKIKSLELKKLKAIKL